MSGTSQEDRIWFHGFVWGVVGGLIIALIGGVVIGWLGQRDLGPPIPPIVEQRIGGITGRLYTEVPFNSEGRVTSHCWAEFENGVLVRVGCNEFAPAPHREDEQPIEGREAPPDEGGNR